MEGEHLQEINLINAQINQMKIDHEKFVQKLEANYNEKLITEYNNYLRFELKMEKLLKEQEDRYMELRKDKEVSEEFLNTNYEEKLKEKDILYEEVYIKYFPYKSNINDPSF